MNEYGEQKHHFFSKVTNLPSTANTEYGEPLLYVLATDRVDPTILLRNTTGVH